MKRELVFSTVIHVVLLAALGIISAIGARPRTRPQVYQVTLVSGGTPESRTETRPEQTRVVEPEPKPEAKPEPRTETKPEAKPKPEPSKPRPSRETVRRQGLGARIEGAQALGYSYYLNVILARISENWLNPYAGQNRAILATVFFVVERDGTIGEVKLEKSSGDAAYDASCTRALLVTGKLPPLPSEFTGERLRLHLEFEYKP
ncbi:MAG TPA: TonB family protein [candidate division WOR-3 bacterium]|uniref:TonB family protein n=1 Tax=candidate division WOR-3 bacterium TaxID=2052148 RepID=A0A7V0T590_UNCW3|nr:TonB family protein [candidate division WOR-3 bacterium]